MSGRPVFNVERTAPTAIAIDVDLSKGREAWFLLSSDRHHDNAHCDQRLEKRHLEEARDKGAGVLDFGDLFCAMQGKWDKRADQEQLRPEHRGNRYLDQLVSTAADFYGDFAPNLLLMSRGNHEKSILKRHQTDLTDRLAEHLRGAGGAPQVGTYAGWVWFRALLTKTARSSLRLRYTHGYGGGGPVTKDLIQGHRQAAYIQNADIICSGHTHDQWIVPHVVEALSRHGVPEVREVVLCKCGGYKDEFTPGEGWSPEKGIAPKPLGALWLRLWREARESEFRIRFDVTRAT